MKFNKKKENLILTYGMLSNLTAEVAEEMVTDIRSELSNSPEIESVLFSLEGYSIDYKSLKVLTPIGLELRKANKHIFALSENKYVHSLIRQEGMDNIIRPITDVREINPGAAPKKTAPKLDVNFINPFVEGTILVLNVQCKTQAVPAKPCLKSAGTFKCSTDIAGIIGITSQSFHGSIAICFPAQVFLGLMSKMLGEEFTEINDDLKDGAAELTNMIFGHAKKVLNEKGHTIEKALPSVIRGPDLKIDHSGSQDAVILPFHIEDKTFFMEIATEQT